MVTSQEYVEYIRTLVRGDTEANDRIEAKFDQGGWGAAFPKFLASLFFLSVDRRFGETLDKTQVIRFVAEIRAGLSNGGPDIDAHAAETLIASIIDPTVDYNIDQETIGKIQAATIYKVLSESNLADRELDELLEEAARIATRAA